MKFKPCPFCGNEYVSVIPAVDKSAWWCKCEDCGVATECFKTKLEAIEFWNQRKDDSRRNESVVEERTMSVLIKGMEMPTGNDELRLIIHSNGQVIIDKKTYWEETEAVSVPSHGRLIDADALLNRDADYEYPLFDTDGSWDCVVPCYDRETIKSAPTVIEAEGNNATS